MFRAIVLIIICFVGAASLYWDFLMRSEAAPTFTGSRPRAGVVFTGQFDRIHMGLDLLAEGAVDRLFITGANAGAGINVLKFSDQFDLSPRQVVALANGNIVLATEANTTLENAIEAACWLRVHPEMREVLLVTSHRHLARASLTLERALPEGVGMVRLASDPHAVRLGLKEQAPEFLKYSATWMITLLPQSFWTSAAPQLCGAE